MGKAMEDMTATASGKLKMKIGSSPAAIFTFVASLVRTNLECELVQRGGSLLAHPPPRYKSRNDCIVPLMVVAGAHARILRGADAALGAGGAWRALQPPAAAAAAGAPPEPPVPSPLGPHDSRPVPLLLKDPLALLTHFLLLAPPNPPQIDLRECPPVVPSFHRCSFAENIRL